MPASLSFPVSLPPLPVFQLLSLKNSITPPPSNESPVATSVGAASLIQPLPSLPVPLILPPWPPLFFGLTYAISSSSLVTVNGTSSSSSSTTSTTNSSTSGQSTASGTSSTNGTAQSTTTTVTEAEKETLRSLQLARALLTVIGGKAQTGQTNNLFVNVAKTLKDEASAQGLDLKNLSFLV